MVCFLHVACLQTNSENGLPFFRGYDQAGAGKPNRRIHHQHQAIIPNYKFNCCGNITAWGVDLNPDTALQFQPGDVLGLYVEQHDDITGFDDGVVVLNNGSHTSELVWFASVDIARISQPPSSSPSLLAAAPT